MRVGLYALILLLTSACATPPSPVPSIAASAGFQVSVRSIPGYVLECPDADNPCIVPVKVRASTSSDATPLKCIAKIDYETIRLKDDTRLFFQLVNIDDGVRLIYEFDETGGGLKFTAGTPAKAQMKHRRFYLGKTVSEWRGGPTKTTLDGFDYEPRVTTRSGEPCYAKDPKIANDG